MRVQAYRRIGIAAVVWAVLLSPCLAWGGPGDGLKAGDFTLVPKLTLSGGYDSNVFRIADQEDFNLEQRGSAKGRVTPSLDISSPTDRIFVFDFGSSVTWEQYFNPQRQTRQQSGLSTSLSASGALNKKGNFSLSLSEAFKRSNEPPPSPSRVSYNRIVNTLGATFGIHPGARLVTADLGYKWSRYWHQTDQLKSLNRSRHKFHLNTKYNFLPKTGVFINASYGLIRYDSPARSEGQTDTGDPISNTNSQPLRLTGGISGLITQRISVQGSAGYGWSFYNAGDQFAGVIGSAAVGYAYGPLELDNVLQLGYKFGFDDSSLGNFYTNHRVFMKLQQGLFDKRLKFKADVAFDIRAYSFNPNSVSALAGDENLDDQLLTAGVGLDYNIRKWWSAGISYDLRWNFTDDEFLAANPTDPTEPSVPVLRRYVKHTVFVNTTLRY